MTADTHHEDLRGASLKNDPSNRSTPSVPAEGVVNERYLRNPPETGSELRTIEANCAAGYFRSWVGMPIKWRGANRRPIPDHWRSVGSRSSPYHLAGNRNAAHPVNAILNYAYATLESEIRIKTISEGYDPTLGRPCGNSKT
jgi:CRISPR/Cas system-associated endonuclease Cas1